MNNEMVQYTPENFVAEITSENASYCSLVPKTDVDKEIMFNAVNAPEYKISDEIGDVIKVKDVYVETVETVDQKTGEMVTCPRVVLIDDKGKGHHSISKGIFSALKKLFAIYGTPDAWDKPLPIKIMQISRGANRMFTFTVVK